MADPVPFNVGDAVLFRDHHMPGQGMQPATIAEVLTVPSGALYVLKLKRGGTVQPVVPDEITLADDAGAGLEMPGS